jgi:hypothetical protein
MSQKSNPFFVPPNLLGNIFPVGENSLLLPHDRTKNDDDSRVGGFLFVGQVEGKLGIIECRPKRLPAKNEQTHEGWKGRGGSSYVCLLHVPPRRVLVERTHVHKKNAP